MKKIIFFAIFFFNFFNFYVSQIHRASNKHDYQMKYDSNYTANFFLKQLNLEQNAKLSNEYMSKTFGLDDQKFLVWVSTVIGTLFVGICGIIPVIVLPQLADDHHKLGRSLVQLVK